MQLGRFLYEVDTAVANAQDTRTARRLFRNFPSLYRMFAYIAKTGRTDAVRVAYEAFENPSLYAVGEAAGDGSLAVVQLVVQLSEKKRIEDADESSIFRGALVGAAEHNNVEVVAWLSNEFDFPNKDDENWQECALRRAAQQNNFAVVDILLGNGARDLNTALFDAAYSSKSSIAMYEYLIARGASNFSSAVRGAAYAGSSQKVTFFVSKANGGVLDLDRALAAAVYGAFCIPKRTKNSDEHAHGDALGPWYDVISLLSRLGTTDDLNYALHCAAHHPGGGEARLPMVKFLENILVNTTNSENL